MFSGERKREKLMPMKIKNKSSICDKQVLINSFVFFIFAFVFFAVGGLPNVAKAASLYFSPSSGSYNIGSTITVNVDVSSSDKVMNAVSGAVSFPKDKLEAISLSKTGSIISLWTQEPSFSNTAGTVNFEGILFNPGFTGASGKIISIVFKVKAEGISTLSFPSGSVLANDGSGTDIFSGSETASFSLNKSVTPTKMPIAPVPPVVSSSTNSDNEKSNKFEISQVQQNDSTNSNVKFLFNVEDKTSSIDHFEVYVDNQETTNWIDDGSHIYQISNMSPGRHVLVARAVDKAGNYFANFAEFFIDKVDPPVITYYPKELQSGEALAVKGTTLHPNTKVIVYLQKKNGETLNWPATSDENNNFFLTVYEKLGNGDYKLWAVAENVSGTSSIQTPNLSLFIGSPVFFRLGQWTITLIDVIIFLAVFAFILILLLLRMHYKFRKFKKKISKKVCD